MRKDEKVNVLIVGSGEHPIYASALYRGMEELSNVDVQTYYWNDIFNKSKSNKYVKKIEFKFSIGHIIKKINRDIVLFCKNNHIDLVFLYTSRMIKPETIIAVKKMGTKVFSYCNDDPFSDYFPLYFWRLYKKSLFESDINYVYRIKNIDDVANYCGVKPQLLRSYYLKDKNFPCSYSELLSGTPDVLFLGHDENDERKEYIKALADKGISVGVPRKDYEKTLGRYKNIVMLDNERQLYNRYLCSCKIPLVFLSKINHDTYTRRCFEIPAAGAFLFCPYTDDLASMFEEDKEIVFYHTKDDFVEKVIYYLEHDEERMCIATAGHERLLRDGHEVKDRAEQIIKDYKRLADR